MTTEQRQTVPVKMRPIFDAIVERTDAFCAAYLTGEYAQLCRKLATTLARKRSSPLGNGTVEGWAAGILYAIGSTGNPKEPVSKSGWRGRIVVWRGAGRGGWWACPRDAGSMRLMLGSPPSP